ncbi:hypothetical protein B0H14DRAFT_3493623 [Mycena olivaceomarginata]|nr:hypothetical protein B0H14DRAFT_3493623 [Mycena olivaceomarginata]
MSQAIDPAASAVTAVQAISSASLRLQATVLSARPSHHLFPPLLRPARPPAHPAHPPVCPRPPPVAAPPALLRARARPRCCDYAATTLGAHTTGAGSPCFWGRRSRKDGAADAALPTIPALVPPRPPYIQDPQDGCPTRARRAFGADGAGDPAPPALGAAILGSQRRAPEFAAGASSYGQRRGRRRMGQTIPLLPPPPAPPAPRPPAPPPCSNAGVRRGWTAQGSENGRDHPARDSAAASSRPPPALPAPVRPHRRPALMRELGGGWTAQESGNGSPDPARDSATASTTHRAPAPSPDPTLPALASILLRPATGWQPRHPKHAMTG